MDKSKLIPVILLLIFSLCSKAIIKIESIPANVSRETTKEQYIVLPLEPFDQNVERPAFGAIYFPFNSAEIMQESMGAVNSIVEFLRVALDAKVIIEGYCDERGSEDYNLLLGERRSMAVRDLLVARGADGDNLMMVSYGEGALAETRCQDEACHGKNRRVMVR